MNNNHMNKTWGDFITTALYDAIALWELGFGNGRWMSRCGSIAMVVAVCSFARSMA